MKYFIDTEFLEGQQNKTLFGISYGKTKPTIDLISIGIVAEDGRKYYAISKDFNIKEAWDRYQYQDSTNLSTGLIEKGKSNKKEFWLRENVLKPIYKELIIKEIEEEYGEAFVDFTNTRYTFKEFKKLINKYGKTNKEISEEIKTFCLDEVIIIKNKNNKYVASLDPIKGKPEFYAYYADYDWVVFCWLFGNMIDLPKSFPMYCTDLKQILDEKLKNYKLYFTDIEIKSEEALYEYKLKFIEKNHPKYPKQTNEHNALADAQWNKELYFFLKELTQHE